MDGIIEENIKSFAKGFVDNQSRIAEIEDENRKLKDNVEFLTQCLDDRDKSIELMKEENKKLKEENQTLKDKIEFLTNCLDDRDKSIELLKGELKCYKKQYEHSMGED